MNGRELPKECEAFIIFAPDGKKSDSVTVPVANGRYDSPKTPTGAVTAFFEINVPGPTKKSSIRDKIIRMSKASCRPNMRLGFHYMSKATNRIETSN